MVGSAVIEAIDDAEQHQQRRLEQVRDQGGEVVVVAEADLGHADGVVLVDDRQAAPLEQRDDGVAGVEVARPAVEVAGGQQNLGGGDAGGGPGTPRRRTSANAWPMAAQAWSWRRSVGRRARPSRPMPAPMAPELTRATLAALATEPLELVGQRLEMLAGSSVPSARGEHVGAHLDDDGVGQGDDFLTNGIDHNFPTESDASQKRPAEDASA